MKKKIKVYEGKKQVERYITTIPARYLFAILIIALEFLAVMAIMVQLSLYSQLFMLAELLTQIGCVISIISRPDNPDYKVPWLLFILIVPIVGFMSYLMFYSRKLSRRQIKQLKKIDTFSQKAIESDEYKKIKDPLFRSQAMAIKNLSRATLYQNTAVKYFALGEEYFASLLEDVKNANEFIFLEYFILERGKFWNSILEVLKDKVKQGLDVRVLYDDIGCMSKLPGNYDKRLKKLGIKCAIFSRLRGQVNNEFNNRNHRKIAVIDGKIAYTGGINLADEYINHVKLFGHWKDTGIRLEGEAVNEFTKIFIADYELSVKDNDIKYELYLRDYSVENGGFCMPFSDGPRPIFNAQVCKTAILNMLSHAKKYIYITTPYLIIDNELTSALENTAIRGVDVRIITPHIPDKKIVFTVTRSSYKSLIKAGVKIYEYAQGFIHAKTYFSDDEVAILGTINLDYRSLVHHFENGVWLYHHEVIKDVKNDFLETQEKSIEIEENQFVGGPIKRFFNAAIKVFTPLL